MKKQSLSQIIFEYIQEYNIPIGQNENCEIATITTTSFYKQSVKKLQTILSSFGIDMKQFLGENKKSYYFTESKDEIITMLEKFDNPLVKKIRLKRDIDYQFIFSNDEPEQQMKEAVEFAEALKCFMKKNGFRLPKEFTEYDSTGDFNDDLAEAIEKLALYEFNKSRFDTQEIKKEIFDVLLDIKDILLDVNDYMLSTNTYDAMDDEEVKHNLYDLRDDLQKCLDEYKDCFNRFNLYDVNELTDNDANNTDDK